MIQPYDQGLLINHHDTFIKPYEGIISFGFPWLIIRCFMSWWSLEFWLKKKTSQRHRNRKIFSSKQLVGSVFWGGNQLSGWNCEKQKSYFNGLFELDYISLSQWLNGLNFLGWRIFSGENKVQTFFFRVHWLSEIYPRCSMWQQYLPRPFPFVHLRPFSTFHSVPWTARIWVLLINLLI